MKATTGISVSISIVFSCLFVACVLLSADSQDSTSTYVEPPAETYSVATMHIAIKEETQSVNAAQVTADFFKAAHVRPYVGRFFLDTEYRASAHPRDVVVVSHDFWQRAFGGSPEIIGTALKIDGHPFTIVGLTPPNFAVPKDVQLWIPKQASSVLPKRD